MKYKKVKITQSCPTLCDLMDYYSPWNSPGHNTGVGSLSLFQGIFPIQGSKASLPHCRRILYQLSHKGSPRILEWEDYPFSRGSSRPRNQTRVSCIAGGFFTNWAIREALIVKRFVELLSHVRFFRDPLDCSPSGSSVHGISQAKVLEWVAIAFSNVWVHASSNYGFIQIYA